MMLPNSTKKLSMCDDLMDASQNKCCGATVANKSAVYAQNQTLCFYDLLSPVSRIYIVTGHGLGSLGLRPDHTLVRNQKQM